MKDGHHSKREHPLAVAACCVSGLLGVIGIYLLCHYGWALFVPFHS